VYWKTEVQGVNAEEGLMGIQKDPNYATNNWVYAFYAPTGDRKSTAFPDSSTKTASGTWVQSKSLWSSILSATFAAIPVDPVLLTQMEIYSYPQVITPLLSTNRAPS
jgi:hypothetical protein